jgi:negative regulator of flagellin synthesis FlgM
MIQGSGGFSPLPLNPAPIPFLLVSISQERTMSSFEIGASRPVGAVQLKTVQPASQASATTATQSATAAATEAAASTEQVQTTVDTSSELPVDAVRVAGIRKAINEGTYPLIPTKIGDAMIAAGMLLQKGR